MWIGPPKALECPKPMSSISTITTFGAPSGALTSKRGGAFALRASISVIGMYVGSATGRIRRSWAGFPLRAGGNRRRFAIGSAAAANRGSQHDGRQKSSDDVGFAKHPQVTPLSTTGPLYPDFSLSAFPRRNSLLSEYEYLAALVLILPIGLW